MASQQNPFLKRQNEQHEFTHAQIAEFTKCAMDVTYFVDKYCFLQHPVKGKIPFTLREYQRDVLFTFQHRLAIALLPRQSGKSWLAGAYLLWDAMFKMDRTIVIASNKNDNAQEMIHRIKFLYENLPFWLKPGLTADGWNKHSVVFDNGSRILSQATTESTGRGLSVSLFFLDEFAFVRDSVAEDFWTSASPTISTGGSCIICSTPNGDTNRFAQLWFGANIPSVDDPTVGINGYAPITVHWTDPPGRDEAFKQAEIAKFGYTKWAQEYECQFISEDKTLIDQLVLATVDKRAKGIEPFAVKNDITFFEEPIEDATYVVGVDPATGTGSDYTTIVAFRFPEMKQVAEFRSNSTSSVMVYHILKRLLKTYENAGAKASYFSVENNGVGEGIIALYESDETVVDNAEFVSEDGRNRLGMTTTNKSKLQACLTLKDMIERHMMEINSKVLAAELKTYVRTGASYAAKKGSTDDLVSSVLICMRIIALMASYDAIAYETMYGGGSGGEVWSEEDDDGGGFVF